MNQTTLFNDQKRFEAWKKFHVDNPSVFEWFEIYANEALIAGRKVGARMIGERIRWKTSIEIKGGESPKFNDHIWPYMARLLMATDDRFSEFFVIKDKNFDTSVDEIVEAHNAK